MKIYYLNTRPKAGGVMEVHLQSCPYIGSFMNRTLLGEFSDPQKAIELARQSVRFVEACKFCITPLKKV